MEVRVKQQHTKVEPEINKVKGEVEAQKQEIKGIKEAINEIAAAVEQQKHVKKEIESDESLWSTIVGKHVEKKLETVTGEMLQVQKTVMEAKQQLTRREKRIKDGIILLFTGQQSQAAGPETRKREDFEFCCSLVQDVLEVGCEDDEIESIIRLGEKS